MPGYALLIDLHKRSLRQGPGGETETALALSLANLPGSRRLKILDIGCGTGAATRQLARVLNADVTALDLVWDFIAILAKNVRAEELSDRVIPIVGTMDSMPFSAGEFDLIWSEGAVYNMGFERGVRAWKHFLAPGGILVVSDLTWTTAARPAALQQFWDKEYPEVATRRGTRSRFSNGRVTRSATTFCYQSIAGLIITIGHYSRAFQTLCAGTRAASKPLNSSRSTSGKLRCITSTKIITVTAFT